MLSPSVTCAGPVFAIARSGAGTVIVIVSLKAGPPDIPFSRNWTVQPYVPASVPALTPYVSLNVKVVPLTAVWLGGVSDALTPGSQLTVCVTITGRFERPSRIA